MSANQPIEPYARIRLITTNRSGTLLATYHDEARGMYIHTVHWDDERIPVLVATWKPMHEHAEELAR